MASQLYIDNDNNIVIKGLRLASTGAYISDALFTGVLKDRTGTVISGASSISFAYTSGSDGDYRGLVASTVDLTRGARVFATITCSNYGIKFENVELPILRREG